MVGVGNGLRQEGEGGEIAHDQVADQHHYEDGHGAPQQVGILQHKGITHAAGHAKAGTLSQGTHHQCSGEGHQHGSVHRAGALLRGVEQAGDQQSQGKQHQHNHRQHKALGLLGLIGTAQVEALLQEDGAHQCPDNEAQQTHEGVEVAATHTQQHTKRAAQKYQGADHHQRTHGKAGGGSGAGLGPELLTDEGHDAGAQDDADNLGADILHDLGTVQAHGTHDVTLEAGDAEAHVLGIAQGLQQQSRRAHHNARDNHQPVFLEKPFHNVNNPFSFCNCWFVIFII